jgi:carbamoyltransferase
LNTSFNIHGEPIVYSPSDAIDVFLRSGLEYLALDRHLLCKPKAA